MNAILFDIDGTLLQSADVDDRLYRQSVSAVLGPVDFRPSLADYEYVTDAGILAQLLDDNGLSDIPDPTHEIQARFVASLKRHISKCGPFTEVPGARDFVATLLGSENHRVAIATGGWRVSALLKLDSAGFDAAAIPIATSDEHVDRSRIMQSALAKLGKGFETITYYGDGTWDRDACASLGWSFVPVGRTLNGLESFSAVAAG